MPFMKKEKYRYVKKNRLGDDSDFDSEAIKERPIARL